MIRQVLDWENPEVTVSSSEIPSSLPFSLPKTLTRFQVNTSTLFMQNACNGKTPGPRSLLGSLYWSQKRAQEKGMDES